MPKHGLRLLTSLSIIVGIHFPHVVYAQAVPEAVYNDVKEIITDVLEQDVANEVGPHLACLAGRIRERHLEDAGIDSGELDPGGVPPNVRVGEAVYKLEAERYFPRTLQHVYDGQYSTLRTAVVDEASQIVGDIVYHLLLHPSDEPSEACSSDAGTDADSNAARAGCEAHARAAVLKHHSVAPAHGILFEPLSDTELELCATAVREQMKNHALASVESPLSRECSATTGSPSQDGGLVRANEYACDLAEGVAKTIEGDKSGAEDSLRRAIAEILVEAILHRRPTQAELNTTVTILSTLLDASTSLAAGGTSPSTLLTTAEAQLATALTPTGRTAAVPANAAPPAVTLTPAVVPTVVETAPPQPRGTGRAQARAASIAPSPATVAPAAAPAVVQSPATPPPPALAAVASELLQKLYFQWKSIQPKGGSAVTITTVLDGLAMLASDIRPICEADERLLKAPACQILLNDKAAITVTSEVFPIIRQASKGDLASAVQLAVGEMFEGASDHCRKTKGTGKGCTLLPVYRDMANAIVNYVIESDGGKAPSSSTRATLIATGSRFILEVGQGGGIDRPTLPTSRSGWTFFYPDLALRYSFSPSYAFAGTSSSRVTASLPWLNFRLPIYRRQLVYVGAEFSLIDPLAPLSEMVGSPSQSTVNYQKQERLAFNLFAPRLDFNVGVPALAKNLVVGGGASLRMVAPWFASSATATAPTTYEYDFCFNKTFADCVEFGFFAKYVM